MSQIITVSDHGAPLFKKGRWIGLQALPFPYPPYLLSLRIGYTP